MSDLLKGLANTDIVSGARGLLKGTGPLQIARYGYNQLYGKHKLNKKINIMDFTLSENVPTAIRKQAGDDNSGFIVNLVSKQDVSNPNTAKQDAKNQSEITDNIKKAGNKVTTNIVQMPKPNTLQISYPKAWNTSQLGQFTRTVKENLAGSIYGNNSFNLGGNTEALGQAAMGKVKEIPADILGLNTALAATGIRAVNNNNVFVFEGIPFREIQFSWLLAPKNAQDAQQIIEWLDVLKIETTTDRIGDYYWAIPSTFSVQFSSKKEDGEDSIFFKSPDMACTNLSINYTPNGIWTQSKSGFPTSITVDMSFTERKEVTKKDLESGLYI